jgi:transcriptional regulator with XRE-family HTH domain
MAINKTAQTTVANDGTALRPFLVPAVRPSDLTRRAGVSRQYVSAVLLGHRPPSARIVEAAAELGLPVHVLFRERGDVSG